MTTRTVSPLSTISPRRETETPHGEKTLNGIVFSDLHIGAPYADRLKALQVLDKELEKKDTKFCVLLGDVYEGVNLPTKHFSKKEEETALALWIREHTDHLRDLVQKHGHCQFYYVVGNHERLEPMLDALHKLAKEPGMERLRIDEQYVKIGNGLFVHGDQQLKPDIYRLDEKKFDEAKVEFYRPLWLQVIHDRLNKVLPYAVGVAIHRAKQCATKIVNWIDRHNPAMLDGVTDVFSGHTHHPYTNVLLQIAKPGKTITHFDDLRFHNTGASLSRLGHVNLDVFNPLRVTLQANDAANTADTAHAFFQDYRIAGVEQIMAAQHAQAQRR